MKTMKKTARLLTAFLLALTLMAAELSPALAVTQADIDAPRSIKIYRGEIYRAIQEENKQAATLVPKDIDLSALPKL